MVVWLNVWEKQILHKPFICCVLRVDSVGVESTSSRSSYWTYFHVQISSSFRIVTEPECLLSNKVIICRQCELKEHYWLQNVHLHVLFRWGVISVEIFTSLIEFVVLFYYSLPHCRVSLIYWVNSSFDILLTPQVLRTVKEFTTIDRLELSIASSSSHHLSMFDLHYSSDSLPSVQVSNQASTCFYISVSSIF